MLACRPKPLEVLSELSRSTMTPVHVLQGHSLSAFAGRLFPELVRNGNTPWVLPLGIFHRRFRRAGLSFCPECLATNQLYFRRRWRLSLATTCLTHLRPLLDACPGCNAPLQPHRIEVGSKNPYTSSPLYNCSVCSTDLRISQLDGDADPRLWQAERDSNHLLMHPLCDTKLAAEHFSILRHVLAMLTSSRSRVAAFRFVVADRTHLPIIESWRKSDLNPLGFDAMQIEQRRAFLTAAYWLTDEWPNRFRQMAFEGRLRKSDLTRDFPLMPQRFSAAIMGSA